MADPAGRDFGASSATARQRASIQTRADRPPSPANDNPLGFAKACRQLVPVLMAVVFLAWALWSAFL